MAARAGCPEPRSIMVSNIYPNDDIGRHRVAQLAMQAAYVEKYHIYTYEEMARFEKEAQPSWEQGKEERRFIATLFGEIVGVSDMTRLDDGWRLVEPMHVLPHLWGCGIGTMLWKRCINDARAAGSPGLRVWSLVKNKQAGDFYEGRGCKAVTTGTLTLPADPQIGNAKHVERVIGYECSLV